MTPGNALPGSPGTLVLHLEAFQGPLDVLLHLVRTGALDLTGLPVAEIARQYDRYLDGLGSPDPEGAGEALVQIATIVYMKSRGLLPPDPRAPEEFASVGDGTDGVLVGTEGLRVAADHLREREAAMELVFARSPQGIAEFSGEESIEADLYALVRAFRDILGRLGNDERSRISRERVSLVERIDWLMDRLNRSRRLEFRTLFAGLEDRMDCILTFLALLELLRLRLARAWTSHAGSDILIVHGEDAESPPGEPDLEEPVHV